MSDLFSGPNPRPRKGSKGSIWHPQPRRRKKSDPVTKAKKAVRRAAKKQVRKVSRRANKKIMDLGDAIGRALRGERAKEKTPYSKIKDLIKTYGLEEAIRRSGVTKATFEGWIKKDRKKRTKPSAKSQKKIDAAHDSPNVRAATTPKRKAAKMAAEGMKITVNGNIGPRESIYQRMRGITAHVPPEMAEHIMEKWREEGPEGAKGAILEALATEYFDRKPGEEWSVVADQLTQFDITPNESGMTQKDFDE